jgi:hypothetical protein
MLGILLGLAIGTTEGSAEVGQVGLENGTPVGETEGRNNR